MFNLTTTPTARPKSTHLKANAIHDVTFDGVFAEEKENKDKTEKYNVLSIKFSNKDGQEFEDVIFEPKEGDEVRRPNNFGYENPAATEEISFKVKHLISAVNPALAKSIDEKKGGVIATTWAELVKFLVTNLKKSIGVETQIKLVANSQGYAQFPRYVLGINKKNEVYPKTSFIGAGLTFTAKELEKIDTTESATPTTMPDETPSLDGIDTDLSGIGDMDINIDIENI